MGTSQALTTEQVEILILIDEINEYLAENNITLEVPMSETIDGCIATEDRCVEICEVLEYYGYIKSVGNDYALTVDGKQYISLFEDYLKSKATNPAVVHNSFSLISCENLIKSFEVCLGKIDISLPKFDIIDKIKNMIQASNGK